MAVESINAAPANPNLNQNQPPKSIEPVEVRPEEAKVQLSDLNPPEENKVALKTVDLGSAGNTSPVKNTGQNIDFLA